MAQVVAPAGPPGALGPSRTVGRTQGASYRYWVLITVVFGAFVSILDNTIVNTALPKIQAIFGADLHEASYVATGYTLAAGVVVPATGYMANRFGIKRIYLGSLAAFTVGSALCGLSWSMGSLIFFRILQGAGGAALFPLSFAILFSVFPPEERGRANGIFGIPVLFAPAIGPTVGGFLVQYVDWRWIFYVNVPIGIAGILLGRVVLRESIAQPKLHFDLRGFLIAAAGLGLLLYGTSNLAYDGWNSVLTVSGPIILSVILLVTWIFVELRTAVPLLDLRLFASRNFFWGNVVTWIGTVSIFGPTFLLPQFLQNLRGLDPFPAGLLLFSAGVGTVMGTIAAGNLYNRWGPRVMIIIGTLLAVGSSYALMRWATLDSPYSVLPWILIVRGFGLPFALQSASTASLFGVTGRALPGATTLNVVMRQAVGALSIAGLTNVVRSQQTAHNAHLASQVTFSNPSFNAFYQGLVAHFQALGETASQAAHSALGEIAGQIARQATALAYQDVFLITTIIALPTVVIAFLLRPPKNNFAPGPRPLPPAE